MTEEEKSLFVPQNQETPLTVVKKAALAYRFAYARAAETQEIDDVGQDYLTILEGKKSLAFALCDGVSQSFYGNLAAQHLGDALIRWLSGDLDPACTQKEMQNKLENYLQHLTDSATEVVRKFPLPPDISEMLRVVLEEKRALGSQSTFVCGRIDLPDALIPAGRIILAWMGDSRLKAWCKGNDKPIDLGGVFNTDQRWATNRGLLNGNPYIYMTTLGAEEQEIDRIVSYSDGLYALDNWDTEPSNAHIEEMIAHAGQSSTSDDISLLEIWLGAAPADILMNPLNAPYFVGIGYRDGSIKATWKSVPDATGYQVEFNDHVKEQQTSRQWEFPILAPGKYNLRVRAWQNTIPGLWSDIQVAEVPKLIESQVDDGKVPSTQPYTPSIIDAHTPLLNKQPIKQKFIWAGIIGILLVCILLGGLTLPQKGVLHWLVFPLTPTSTSTPIIITVPIVKLTSTQMVTVTSTSVPTKTLTVTPTAAVLPTDSLPPTPTVTVNALLTPMVTPQLLHTPSTTSTIPITTTTKALP